MAQDPDSPRERHPAGRGRRWTRRATAVCAACAIAGTVPAAGAFATPTPSAHDLKTQIRKLNTKAEKATEAFNGGRVKLHKAQLKEKKAKKALRKTNHRFNQVRRKVRASARTQYITGGHSSGLSSLVGEGPQQVIDRSAIVTHLDRNQTALLKSLKSDEIRLTKQKKSTQQATGKAKKTADRLGGQKRGAAKAVKRVKGKLKDLRRKQQRERQREQRRNASNGGSNTPDSPTNPSNPSNPSTSPNQNTKPPKVSGNGKAAGAVKAALSQRGKPYVWGADGPSSYDCSGLTMWAYKQVGISVPHYTVAQYNAGTSVPSSSMKPGDLVFFGSDMHHVGMFIGNNKMVHAPHTGSVVQVVSMAGHYRSEISGVARYTG